MDGEYVNISICSQLSGCSYIKLPGKLRNSRKGVINIKTMTINAYVNVILDIKSKSSKKERNLQKQIEIGLMILIMKVSNFLFLKDIIGELKRKIVFASMFFVMRMVWLILFMYQIEIFENCIDFLMMSK